MIFLGVDPGLSGALAFCSEDATALTTFDIPTIGVGTKRRVDGANIARLVRMYAPGYAVVELVTAMKGWGAGSSFRFGEATGTIIGTLAACGIPVERVVPRVWKSTFNLGSDKEESRQRAIQLFPRFAGAFELRKDHQRAEAALLAVWLGRKLRGAHVGQPVEQGAAA